MSFKSAIIEISTRFISFSAHTNFDFPFLSMIVTVTAEVQTAKTGGMTILEEGRRSAE